MEGFIPGVLLGALSIGVLVILVFSCSWKERIHIDVQHCVAAGADEGAAYKEFMK